MAKTMKETVDGRDDYRMFINGAWTDSVSGKRIDVASPTTEEILFSVPKGTKQDAQLELEFGEIYVNRPMGEQRQGFHNGYKLSGTGGEDGKYGMENYLEKKTMYVNFSE